MFELGPVCGFCQKPANYRVLGPLLGPIQGTEYYVHRPCALWSPEVHESEEGTLHRVLEAVRRGRQLKCSKCGIRGASVGCRVRKCRETYHALCAHEAGCPMYHTYCIACPQHGKRYKKHELHPQPFFLVPSAPTPAKDPATGTTAADQETGERGGGGTGGITDFFSPLNLKTGRDIAKDHTAAGTEGIREEAAGDDERTGPSVTRAGRKKRSRGQLDEAYARKAQAEQIMKRVRAQHRKAPVDYVSDDEEHFSKRESARMQRDIAKLNPITLGAVTAGGAAASTAGAGATATAAAAAAPRAAQSVYIKAPKGAPKTAAPQVELAANTSIVDAVTATDFDDLAGMDDVVRQLREMVLLSLQYSELFRHLNVSPPRGILFHGVPGTGKTLAARALAGACARHSPVPVTFFARKGADCLGKFVGEAERTLRLIFQEASARAPAIIFLDELDALVPARGRGSGHQDQIHASVVSTLLTLMDGMADRGNVVVIASTNRPDDIDPALRRPGRFDREVYFGLPQAVQRESILKSHTRRWEPVPDDTVVKALAAVTDGYAGADLAALCTAAVMNAVKRAAPQLLEHAEALAGGDSSSLDSDKNLGNCVAPRIPDNLCVEQMDWDAALASAPPPCSKRQAAQALAADARRPMVYSTAPLLLPLLQNILQTVGKSALPLPLAVKQATEAAIQVSAAVVESPLESTLTSLGAIQRAPNHLAATTTTTTNHTPLPSTPSATDIAIAPLSTSDAAPPAIGAQPLSTKNRTTTNSIGTCCPPLRLLISSTTGEDIGQDQLAGAVLRLFGGSLVSVISLPAIVAEGAGDAAQGVVSLVQAALQRADRHSTLVLHLPHVEAWAVASDVFVLQQEVQEEEEEEANKEAKIADFNGNDALSPTSPSFAGLSARSLRMGATTNNSKNTSATAAGATVTATHYQKSPVLEDEEEYSIMPTSDAWIAFESLIQEAAPQRPILILATTRAPRDLLPFNLINGFESSGGVVCVDSHWNTPDNKAKMEMVVSEGMKRVQETAKNAFASHAASVFLDRLLEFLQKSSTEERKISKEAKDVASENPVKSSSPTSLPAVITPSPTSAEVENLDQIILAKRKAVTLNNSEWEKAQELFTSVQRFLVALGATLAKDRRCRAAGATFPPKKTNSNKRKISPLQPPEAEHVRLYTLALAAAQGRYLSLEQFQGAIARAVNSISKAAEQEEKTGQEFLHDSDAVALSFSIQDQIASACHSLRTSLELYDPVNVRLLRAATGFAADVAMVYQQKEAEAVAAHLAAVELEMAEMAAAEAVVDAAAEAAELEREEEEKEQGQIIEEGDGIVLVGAEEEDELMEEEGEEERARSPAIHDEGAAAAAGAVENLETSATSPAAQGLKESEEKSAGGLEEEKEEEEENAAPAVVSSPSSPAPLTAAIHRASGEIRADLLKRVQFNTSASIVSTDDFSSVWRAVNEALPVLVAKGMAACEMAVETVLAVQFSVNNEEELAGLRSAFVDALITNLNE